MSLQVLRLNKSRQIKETERQRLIDKRGAFSAKSAELENSINEAETDEDLALINEETDSHETAIAENESAINKLSGEIAEIESIIAEAAERAKEAAKPINPPASLQDNDNIRDGGFSRMRKRYSHNMTPERREEYLKRDEVRGFYERVQKMISENRAVMGTELLIPTVTLELLRDNLDGYSKLVKYVNLKAVKGEGRQTISGEIPEGVWMEMTGALNELSFDFSQVELDGYKVGGFIPIANSRLHDSYINLAGEIEYMLSESIGYALDKAIIYGKGKGDRMPLGFVTALTSPGLSTTNIHKIDGGTNAGAALFKEILRSVGKVKANRAKSPMTFLMNRQTWNVLVMPESLNVNSAGTLVAAANNTFPVLGGNIEFLDFIPFGDIVGGYFEKYLLLEREKADLAVSEHVRFIKDETVFRGTARYDGTPVRPAAFFALNINNEEPTTSIEFAPDKANTAEGGDSGN